jgi:hypothetical protein
LRPVLPAFILNATLSGSCRRRRSTAFQNTSGDTDDHIVGNDGSRTDVAHPLYEANILGLFPAATFASPSDVCRDRGPGTAFDAVRDRDGVRW